MQMVVGNPGDVSFFNTQYACGGLEFKAIPCCLYLWWWLGKGARLTDPSRATLYGLLLVHVNFRGMLSCTTLFTLFSVVYIIIWPFCSSLIERGYHTGRSDQWRYIQIAIYVPVAQMWVLFTFSQKVNDTLNHVCQQSLISSWRREPRQQTLCRLPLELTHFSLPKPLVTPKKRLRRRTPSLACRLFSEDLNHFSRPSEVPLFGMISPKPSLQSPFHRWLVVVWKVITSKSFSWHCCSNMQRLNV